MTERPATPPLVRAVVKVGGALLGEPLHHAAALAAVVHAAARAPLVVVPGGGPFADVVRGVDRATPLPDETAHWMAVLGMEQHAHLIAGRVPRAVLVDGPEEIAAALAAARVPVLAPYRWLRAADPLPHRWEVTSDSIAAWVAARLAAPRLVLLKAAGAAGPDVVDRYLPHALDARTTLAVVTADHLPALASALGDAVGDGGAAAG